MRTEGEYKYVHIEDTHEKTENEVLNSTKSQSPTNNHRITETSTPYLPTDTVANVNKIPMDLGIQSLEHQLSILTSTNSEQALDTTQTI